MGTLSWRCILILLSDPKISFQQQHNLKPNKHI